MADENNGQETAGILQGLGYQPTDLFLNTDGEVVDAGDDVTENVENDDTGEA